MAKGYLKIIKTGRLRACPVFVVSRVTRMPNYCAGCAVVAGAF